MTKPLAAEMYNVVAEWNALIIYINYHINNVRHMPTRIVHMVKSSGLQS
jgi:hypothetical protein